MLEENTNFITERKYYSHIPAIEVTFIEFLSVNISIKLVMLDEPYMIYENWTSTFPVIRCKTEALLYITKVLLRKI